jgi:hypothetical protein
VHNTPFQVSLKFFSKQELVGVQGKLNLEKTAKKPGTTKRGIPVP